MSVALVWIAVALLFAIIEVASVAVVAGFIALGAVAATVAAFAGAGLIIQGVVFAAVSVVGVAGVRRPLLRYLQRRHTPDLLSGASAMIGQPAVVVDAIRGPGMRGHVRIAGEDWPALTEDGSAVESGVTVRVVDIDKTTLVVDPVPLGR